jgi:hypothetical protein
MAVHLASGDLLVAGFTESTLLPGTAGAPQPAHAADGGLTDGFVARLSPDLTLLDTTPSLAFVPVDDAPPLTLVTSAPAQVTGMSAGTRIYIEGASSAYCVSSTNNCGCNVSGGFVSTPGSIGNNDYVCVRQLSGPIPDLIVQTTVHVGGSAAIFRVSTGALLSRGGDPCTLDVDGNGAIEALSDGIIVLRAMLGLTGTSVTNGATGSGSPSRPTWAQIQPYLNGNCGTNFLP